MRSGTGGRSKLSPAGRSRNPASSSSPRSASQNAALTGRISGRLYIGRLALGSGMALSLARIGQSICRMDAANRPTIHFDGPPWPARSKPRVGQSRDHEPREIMAVTDSTIQPDAPYERVGVPTLGFRNYW